MELPVLKDFSLVGGTALSLKFGHRNSIDLDLFYHEKFNTEVIENELKSVFGDDYHVESGHRNFGIFATIRDIKVDIVYFPHKPISKFETQDNIRMYSNSDIAAMKIQAILGRGKKKDFWDLYELLQHYPLQQIIDWHKQKYPNQMLAISIPNAITYFVEANESESPVSYKNQTWESVKQGIQKAVRDYLQ
jgi:predicted nucleotidyltransferase component of viral defense system